jgi:hypothetical protein
LVVVVVDEAGGLLVEVVRWTSCSAVRSTRRS